MGRGEFVVSASDTVFFEYGGDRVEWHGPKAQSNLRKHRVTFEEGGTIFGDESARLHRDPEHFNGEARWILYGLSGANRLLAVVHVERGERIRIISARLMTREERKSYE